MLKTLLASTVLAVSLAGTALAQQTPAPAAASPTPAASTTPTAAAPAADAMLASSVIGKTVYTGVDEEGEAIGEVKDVVINAAGATEALVIGVGGFLGIGEKDVAVNFDRASWSDRDGDRILVVSVTKKDLEAAPAFQRKAVMDGAVTKDTGTPPAAASSGEAAAPPLATPENTEVPLDAAGADPAAVPQTGTTPQMTDPDLAPPADSTAEVELSDGMKPVDAAMLSADKLIGTPVKVADDTKIGEVGDVLLSKDGKLEAYVIDVGGFLGMAQKPVAMSASDIQVMADAKGAMTIYSPYTKEQLQAQPAYDAAAYKANPSSLVLSTPKP